MKKGLFATVVAYVLISLAGCGGGDTVIISAPATTPPPAVVAETPKKAGHLTVTRTPCAKEGPFVLGETKREMLCFVATSDVDLVMDELSMSWFGDVAGDAYITRVHLVLPNGDRATELTDFWAGQLVLKSKVKLAAGHEVALAIVADIPYQYGYTPSTSRIGFVVSGIRVSFDEKKVISVLVPSGIVTKTVAFRQLEQVALVQEYEDHDYVPGQGKTLAVTRIVNPSGVRVKIKDMQLRFMGNIENLEAFVIGCLANLNVTVFDRAGESVASLSKASVATWNVLPTDFTIGVGESVTVHVSADTYGCGASSAGKRLEVVLEVRPTYEGTTMPEYFWAQPSTTTLYIPVYEKG